MSTPGWNPHKKGEHVFNDIAGSVGNAFDTALSLNRANSLMLTGPHGPLRMWDLPGTSAALDRLRRDVVLAAARAVVSPGEVDTERARANSSGQSTRHCFG